MMNFIIKIDMSIEKLKKHDVSFKKTDKFCEKCQISYVLRKLLFFYIIKKPLKKHDVPRTKTFTFCVFFLLVMV